MNDRMSVLDLAFELGGRSMALEKTGFQIVSAVENDQESEKIYKELFGEEGFFLKDLEEIPLKDFPDADIIMGKLNIQFTHGGTKHKAENEKLCEIILYKSPKVFIVEASSAMLSARPMGLKGFFAKIYGYRLFYHVFNDREYSGFPVIATRLYVVGIRKDLAHEEFNFPSPQYDKANLPIFQEAPKNIAPWYRKVKIDGEMKSDQNKYYMKDRGEFRETSFIYFEIFKEMYIIDTIGIRRFTHNELAAVKGLKGYNFNECRNKYMMYKRIVRSCNVFVVEAIGKAVRLYLDDMKLMGESNIGEIKTDVKFRKKKPLKKSSDINILPKHRILSIHVDRLKGIENLDLSIGKRLTAIMGVNGSGKSTLLHALACIYLPCEKGDDYKFSYFFTPNPDANWRNSKFSIKYFDENLQKEVTREYRKDKDRWSPRYANRPKRDAYFVGIESCIPEIEREKKVSFIDYSTNRENDNISQKIIKKAAYILNKNYELLMSHVTKKKKLFGVHTSDDITYSSLSMGAGEQRILKILQLLYGANAYSLVLIDEIDLLLHVTALRRLIETISEVAEVKKLQVIFTTHSMEINKLEKFVDIRYLESLPGKTMVYNAITPDFVYELTEESDKVIEIYVEDLLAETVVKCIATPLNMLRFIKIIKYGAATNSFVLAASFALQDKKIENTLIVLDGDVYRTKEEKDKAINKVLSGTEKNHGEKINFARSFISQFFLEEGIEPERFIYNMLVEMESGNEIVDYAKKLKAVSNSHEWLDKLVDRIGQSRELTLYNIMNIVSEHDRWGRYIHDVRQWLLEKRAELGFDSIKDAEL